MKANYDFAIKNDHLSSPKIITEDEILQMPQCGARITVQDAFKPCDQTKDMKRWSLTVFVWQNDSSCGVDHEPEENSNQEADKDVHFFKDQFKYDVGYNIDVSGLHNALVTCMLLFHMYILC